MQRAEDGVNPESQVDGSQPVDQSQISPRIGGRKEEKRREREETEMRRRGRRER